MKTFKLQRMIFACLRSLARALFAARRRPQAFAGAGIMALLTMTTSFPASIQKHLQTISDFRFQPLVDLAEITDQNSPVEFSAEILKEYVLLSYSEWRVAATSGSGDNPTGTLEVYEVLDPQAAFGLFSIWPDVAKAGDVRSLDLKVDNLIVDHAFLFWRGHYFFRLTWESVSFEENLKELAEAIVDSVQELNLHPVTVVQLPQEGLKKHSIRCYLGPRSLEVNPLFPQVLVSHAGFHKPDLDKAIEVSFGLYGVEEDPLFLLGYPTPAIADHQAAQILNSLQSSVSAREIYLKRTGILVALFIGSEQRAKEVLDRVHYTASVKWVYEKDMRLRDLEKKRGEVSGFLGIVTGSIIFTGLFIVVVLTFGLVAGLIRYQILQRYPLLVREDSMIRLHLNERS